MRRFTIMPIAVLAGCFLAASAKASEWGDLKATFIYDGTAFKAKSLKITSDVEYCSKHAPKDESLVVNPDNHGIANVIAYLYLRRSAPKPPVHPSYRQTAEAKVLLDNKQCRFDPHVVLLRTTQTLVMHNSDDVSHNTKVDTFVNPAINFTIPVHRKMEHQFPRAERLPARVSCSIHPWMTGWVVIKDNPYMGSSDKDGQLLIKNIPIGTWTFQFWHERAGYVREVKQNGETKQWKRGRIEITIQPGVNDLGEVRLAPSLFKD